ncbi:MAG: hypothetical protein WB566_11375 [Terriglobales bacterium]
MAAKRKTKKKLKKIAAKHRLPAKKTVRNKLVKRKTSPKRKSIPRKPSLRKAAGKTKARGKKKADAKAASSARKRTAGGNRSVDAEAFSLQGLRSESAGQSGDLQGLSNVEGADSESVDELIEEGNAFEAGVVAGVESAADADEREVRTHEVPEDDVPPEYLDNE